MPRDTWSKWHRIYSVNLILYKSSDLKPLSPLEVLGEFAKNRFGKNFPVAVLCGCTARFVSDLVGSPADQFSQNEAHMTLIKAQCLFLDLVVLDTSHILHMYIIWLANRDSPGVFTNNDRLCYKPNSHKQAYIRAS